jgi:hypothetical protein
MRSAVLRFALAAAVAVACDPSVTAPSVTTPPSSTRTLPPGLSLEPFYSQWVATNLDHSRFRARWDARDYEAIYALTDDRLRSAVTKERFVAMLAVARERFGTSGRTREIRHETRRVPGTEDVDITTVMDSNFEKGAATETFVWRVTPTNLTYLVSYDVR